MNLSICLLLSICLAFATALPEKRHEAPSNPANDVGANKQGSNDITHHWNSFKDKFNKKYESESEEAKRMEHFRANHELVEQHNKLHDLGLKSYRTGHSHLSDLSHEEFTKLNGYKQPRAVRRQSSYASIMAYGDGHCSEHEAARTTKATTTTTKATTKKSKPSDDSFDWRDYGYVTPVLNQGNCGDCYAFSATGSLEGQHKRRTGKLVQLSAQNILDCTKHNHGCNGGSTEVSFQYIYENGGVDTLESYPYVGVKGQCKFNKSSVGATDIGTVHVAPGEESLKNAVRNIGPISVSIMASQWGFHMYQSGVYSEPGCNTTGRDHAVIVVGYGTDPVQGDYWILKNSWDKYWGMQGYMWLARNKNDMCGISSSPCYPNVP